MPSLIDSLSHLKVKASNFLKYTSAAKNIITRTFSILAILYEEVGNMYITYFHERGQRTKEHDELFMKKSDTDANDWIEL